MIHFKLDQLYRTIPGIFGSRFFKDGWGDLSSTRFLDANNHHSSVKSRMKENLTIHWKSEQRASSYTVKKGYFESPYKDILPKESSVANFALITPNHQSSNRMPVCIVLAPTGDHGFSRRFYIFSQPLLKKGIATLLLENPFYGARKPPEQYRSFLRQVSDLSRMGAALITETNGLITWMKSVGHFGPFVLAGCSMGGLMSSYSGTLSDHKLGIVPCMSPTSALPLFAEGGIFGSGVADWDALKKAVPEGSELSSLVDCMLNLTDLHNWPRPTVPQACIWVSGTHDAYTDPELVKKVTSYWESAEVRWIKAGHVSGQLFKTSYFINAIEDSISRLKELGY